MLVSEMIPKIDASKCVKCWKCVKVCPNNAIEKIQNASCSKCIKYCMFYDVTCDNINCVINYGKCDACGKCISVCEEAAISWSENTENIILGNKLVSHK
jgi:ferredoxin